jgi:hypothetical protein
MDCCAAGQLCDLADELECPPLRQGTHSAHQIKSAPGLYGYTVSVKSLYCGTILACHGERRNLISAGKGDLPGVHYPSNVTQ